MNTAYRLLADNEPPAVMVERPHSASPFLLTCEHAGQRIPARLDSLGLDVPELQRHIAWDIGALAVARGISQALDATLIGQTYSRLVIDCNRLPGVPSSIPKQSEYTEIPGNRDITPIEAQARVTEIFQPYQDRIAAELDARAGAGRPVILVTMHSFTPVFKGISRPWHVGVLYNRDTRFARIVLDLLARLDDLCVGDNEPYIVDDKNDYTIPVHCEARDILHVEFEIRQDLIAEPAGQRAWAARIADLLRRGYQLLSA